MSGDRWSMKGVLYQTKGAEQRLEAEMSMAWIGDSQ